MKHMEKALAVLLVLSALFCCLGSAVSFAADSETKVGDVISFGHFDKNSDTPETGEAIEWLVLDVQDNQALLISKKVLLSRSFNDKGNESSIWEKSSLRKWLDDEFLNAAFTADEQKAILVSTVDNGEEQGSEFWSMLGEPIVGDPTEDKVYILSYAEALKYFHSDSERSCEKNWWLRSPGSIASNLMYVHDDGAVHDNESMWDPSSAGVRPVMKVDLDSLNP